jgi:hypothetical protein
MTSGGVTMYTKLIRNDIKKSKLITVTVTVIFHDK